MAKIDANINSGFCSGNEHVNMGHLNHLTAEPKVCMGTVRFYNGGDKTLTLKEPLNSGAFSSNKTDGKGTVGDKPDHSETDSEVLGTRLSFNVGSKPSERGSFKNVKNLRKPKGNESYGTRGSFNATGGHSKTGIHSMIDANGATINSGYGAGSNISRSEIERFKRYKCRGTEHSFNAKSGQQIIINGARVNTGAFADSRKHS